MSITGNNNILLGGSAALPALNGNNQIVLGGATDTIFMGGSDGTAPRGASVSAAGLLLSSALTVQEGGAGNSGQALLSRGTGLSPYWAAPMILNTASSPFSISAPLAANYTVSGEAAWIAILPPATSFPGASITLKNLSISSGTVQRNIISLSKIVANSYLTMISGDSGRFESNGTYWMVVNANREFPGTDTPPVVTDLSKYSGSSMVPTAITITGQYLLGATMVSLPGVSTVASFTVDSDTQISAVFPALPTLQTSTYTDVVISNPINSSTGGPRYQYIPPPTLSAVVPTTGGYDCLLTLTGTTFIYGGTSLEFLNGDVVVGTASLTMSNYIWTTRVPYIAALTPGSTYLTIRIITVGGTSNYLPFVYNTAPTIASYTRSGAVGALMSITGTNLNSYGSTVATITIGGIPVTNVTSAYDIISGNVPAGDGAENIQVTAYGGTVLAPGPFYYAPTVNMATGAAGETVTITGSNFVVNDTTVSFGTVQAQNVVVEASGLSLTCTVPAGSNSVLLTVTTGGVGTGTTTFYYTPTITSFTNPAGNDAIITITGTNCVNVVSVNIGNSIVSIINTTATSIGCRTPSNGIDSNYASNLPIYVRLFNSTVTSSTNFFYYPNVNNAYGVAGTTITIYGYYFVTGATQIAFGGGPLVDATSVTNTSLQCIVPPGSDEVELTIVTGGIASTANAPYRKPIFNYTPTVNDAFGNAYASCTITGTNFNTNTLSLKVGGITTPIISYTSTSIVFQPVEGSGSLPIIVTVGDLSTNVSATATFYYT